MNITHKKWKEVPNKAEVERLYRSAFPKEEQMPWWLLRLISLRRDMGITAYYSDGAFCGMTVTVGTQQYLFVLFFAVDDGCRGQGYGSEILTLLKRENPNRPIVLNVEPLDERAENAAQRVSRMRFYERNGFFDTGYNIDEVGGTFRVLSNGPLDGQAYLGVFKKLSYGLWKPYIRRVEEDEK
jgi:GNAT superfamily N-acetyltransferase